MRIWSEKFEKDRKKGLSKSEAEKRQTTKWRKLILLPFKAIWKNHSGQNLPAVYLTLRKYKHLLEEMMYLTNDEKQMAKKQMANMMMRMMT